MRAVWFDGKQVTLRTDLAAPEALPGEALVRPTLATIDATDLAVIDAPMPFVGVLGHQFVGVVERVHPSDAGAKLIEGRRVVGAINIVPAADPLARRGLGQHAPQREILGILGRSGVLAERFTLPIANLVPVPDAVTDEQAVLTEPLASALHASRVTHIEGKPFVTIIGDDVIALLAAQIMTKLNASVRLIGRNLARLALCDKWQIKHRPIAEVGLRADQDIVIECTGEPAHVEIAMHMARPRGRVVLRSRIMPTPASKPAAAGPDLTAVVHKELELIGARCGNMSEALALLLRQPIDTNSLISKRFRFDDAIAAFRAAREPDAVCIVIEF